MSEKYQRLSKIIQKLYAGEKLQISLLAKEFQTSTKTIQRDLKERLKSQFLVREGRYFRLNTTRKQENEAFVLDVFKNFAQHLGEEFKHQAQEIVDQFLAFSPHFFAPLHNVSHKAEEILKAQKAILHHRTLSFLYKNNLYKVQPLQIINVRKTLLLQAIHEEKERFFGFEHMTHCMIGRKKIYLAPLDTAKQRVCLFVYPEGANYAQSLLWGEDQKIIKDKNQNLMIEFVCVDLEMLLQEVLSQIPYILIIEPQELAKEAKKRILRFAEQCQIINPPSSPKPSKQYRAHYKISIRKNI